MGPWNSSGALVGSQFATALPCEGGVWDEEHFPVTLGWPIFTGHG